MKVLIAPLNWGLGHASRCLALVVRHLRNGDEVVLAGDGDSLTLMRKHFPNLRYYTLPPLQLTYSKGRRQVGAMLRNLPRLAWGMVRDRVVLRGIMELETFDMVISDNRFGFWTRKTKSVYITHQLAIALPYGWQWAEGMAAWLHRRIIRHYDECWVPDYAEENNLAGRLSHPAILPKNVRYIGPLSRMEGTCEACHEYDVVAVLSGLEPQRSMLEEQLMREWLGRDEKVLLVRGKMGLPPMTMQKKNITLRPYLPDADLASALLGAKLIISRSGYSSIMDYAALGLLKKAQRGELTLRLLPTPGQPEQEYLADMHNRAT